VNAIRKDKWTSNLELKVCAVFPHGKLPSSDNPHIFRSPRTWKHGLS